MDQPISLIMSVVLRQTSISQNEMLFVVCEQCSRLDEELDIDRYVEHILIIMT